MNPNIPTGAMPKSPPTTNIFGEKGASSIISNKDIAKAGVGAVGEKAKIVGGYVGKGAVTAGKGVKKMGKGMAAAGGFLLGSLRNKGGGSEGEFSPGSVWFFIIISLTAHIFDYIFNVFSPFMRVTVYVALAFFAFIQMPFPLFSFINSSILSILLLVLLPPVLVIYLNFHQKYYPLKNLPYVL